MPRVRLLDSHHHLWDLEAHPYPWLQEEVVAAHFGDYSAIRKTYDAIDYLTDTAEVEVVSSVHVEAGMAKTEKLTETRYLCNVAAQHGIPGAIVAHADLVSRTVDADLEAQSAFDLVRGVRNMLFAPGALGKSSDISNCSLFDPAWRYGFSRLATYGLSFDLQAPPPVMMEVAKLLAQHDDVPAVLTHAGLPLDRGEEGMALWRSGMRALAALPHVCVKLSGLPMTDWQWSEQSLRPVVLEVIDLFGPERCMIGSNFPVDGLFSSYTRLIQAYWSITQNLSDTEREAIFVGNAARFYSIDIG
jgi:predicted TIM-barrel fold metal-dependent hydrolase